MTVQHSVHSRKWGSRSLPRAPKRYFIPSVLVFFLSAFCTPLALWSGMPDGFAKAIGVFLLVMLTAYALYAMRMGAMGYILLALAYLSLLSGVSALGGAILLTLFVGSAAGAYLFTVTTKPYWTLAASLAAFVACLAVTRAWLPSVLALVGLPVALAMAWATVRQSTRAATVCCAAGGFALVLAVGVAWWLYESLGTLQGEAVASYVKQLTDSAIDSMLASYRQGLEGLPEAQRASAMQLLEVYTVDVLSDAVRKLFPAMTVVLCTVLGWISQALLLSLHDTTGFQSCTLPSNRIITVSLTAAVVYVLSFFTLLLAPAASFVSVAAQNLLLILMPALCLCGGRWVLRKLTGENGMGRLLVLVLLGFLLCAGVGTGLYLFALFGVPEAYREFTRKRLLQTLKREELE